MQEELEHYTSQQTACLEEQAKQLEQASQQLAECAAAKNELQDESEVLLIQLHQVQEELEHYVIELQQAQQTHQAELAPLQFECGFWRRHAPTEVWVDMRQDISGSGWYEPEEDGRWSGPGLGCTLCLPPLMPGQYALELHLADAMQPELVSGMTVQAVRPDGALIQPIELLHEFGTGPTPYPMVSIGSVELPTLDGPWLLQLNLPFNVSPGEIGGADTRRLGLRVQGIRLCRLEPHPNALHTVDTMEQPAASHHSSVAV